MVVLVEVQNENINHVTEKLLEYCVQNNWAGFDPYDALNSKLFNIFPFLSVKPVRLLLTQSLKRSPLNLRPLFLVPKTHNPKALSLFIISLVRLFRLGLYADRAEIIRLAELLTALRSPGCPQFCWGYSFDWQTRTKLIPRGSPNIICTTFAANALLDAYELTGDAAYRGAAITSADFILEQLWRNQNEEGWFNYTPLEDIQVHNANLLGAALLARVAALQEGKKGEAYIEPALKAARFSVQRQNPDGSWFYGERKRPSQQWIDNFHTGFNLCALKDVAQFSGTAEFDPSIKAGLRFYIENFFEADGAPKYFHNKTFPVDIHSVAQSIITLARVGQNHENMPVSAHKVFSWAHRHMWDSRGFFYFQKYKHWTNRIAYLRWGQAWMLVAVAMLRERNAQREKLVAEEHLLN
jgi:hypothetical protein